MHSRLSQNDVTNLVNVEDASQVRDAIIAMYSARYPGADMAVLLGQDHHQVRLGGAGRQRGQRQEGTERPREPDQLPPPSARTTNSVPRTPMMELGVCTRIASGDCLTILPETTASVPFLSEASNWPACVVLSNA